MENKENLTDRLGENKKKFRFRLKDLFYLTTVTSLSMSSVRILEDKSEYNALICMEATIVTGALWMIDIIYNNWSESEDHLTRNKYY